jgi:effector-binding domain-containing protein
MRRIMLATLGLAALSLTIAVAQDKKDQRDPAAGAQAAQQPAAAAAQDQEPIITKMRVQDYKPVKYFYVETETTIAQMGATVPEQLPKIFAGIMEHSIQVNGPMIFVYHGVTQDREKPFKLEIGFPCGGDPKEAGDYKVRELAEYHCASVIYSGPIAQVGTAYQSLFTELFGASLQPEGETREMYLSWESPESHNNVQVIMQGVK